MVAKCYFHFASIFCWRVSFLNNHFYFVLTIQCLRKSSKTDMIIMVVVGKKSFRMPDTKWTNISSSKFETWPTSKNDTKKIYEFVVKLCLFIWNEIALHIIFISQVCDVRGDRTIERMMWSVMINLKCESLKIISKEIRKSNGYSYVHTTWWLEVFNSEKNANKNE